MSDCRRCKELSAQVVVMRKALIAIAVVDLARKPDRIDYEGGLRLAQDMAREALSSDAGKHHLELEALKDRVVEAARANCVRADFNCLRLPTLKTAEDLDLALKTLDEALSTAEAKQGEKP